MRLPHLVLRMLPTWWSRVLFLSRGMMQRVGGDFKGRKHLTLNES